MQEGKELQAKAKTEAAAKNEAIKAQLATQLAERLQREQQEKQEEMEYAQLEQVSGVPRGTGVAAGLSNRQAVNMLDRFQEAVPQQ